MDLLEGDETVAFAGLYAESLGDAYAALGDVDKAAEAYRVALADTTQTVNRGVVQMKLLDLPEAAPEPAPETAPVAEPEAEPEAAPEEDAAEAASGEEGEETR